MYFALIARQRTVQKAESGIASSIPMSGPNTVAQKKNENMTPAYPSPVLSPWILGVMK